MKWFRWLWLPVLASAAAAVVLPGRPSPVATPPAWRGPEPASVAPEVAGDAAPAEEFPTDFEPPPDEAIEEEIDVLDDLTPEERIEEMKKALEVEPEARRPAVIAAHLKKSKSPLVFGPGLAMLSEAGPPASVWRSLNDLFRNGSLELADAATKLMMSMNPALLISEMTDALVHFDLGVPRHLIAVRRLREVALQEHPGRPPAAATLAYPGLMNPEPQVRQACLEALVEMGTPSIVGRLREYATEEQDSTLSDLALAAAEASEPR